MKQIAGKFKAKIYTNGQHELKVDGNVKSIMQIIVIAILHLSKATGISPHKICAEILQSVEGEIE